MGVFFQKERGIPPLTYAIFLSSPRGIPQAITFPIQSPSSTPVVFCLYSFSWVE